MPLILLRHSAAWPYGQKQTGIPYLLGHFWTKWVVQCCTTHLLVNAEACAKCPRACAGEGRQAQECFFPPMLAGINGEQGHQAVRNTLPTVGQSPFGHFSCPCWFCPNLRGHPTGQGPGRADWVAANPLRGLLAEVFYLLLGFLLSFRLDTRPYPNPH
jgi:hypothetical protein